jgi:hypothetical protein
MGSILFGAAVSYGTLLVFNTTISKFSPANTLLVFVSMGSLAFIWLDFILMTRYLKS